jgi:putative flippase GtrA
MRHLFLGLVPSREVQRFLLVGGSGYVVDVGAFNVLRSFPPFDRVDPSVARILAVLAAMCVTYVGNRTWTWHATGNRRREVTLFVVFNLIGLGLSVLSLVVSHDLLGLTSRLADNVSANVVGLALGTVFRYLTYKRFVFATDTASRPGAPAGPRPVAVSPREPGLVRHAG